MSETSGLTLEQLKIADALEIPLMFGSGIYNMKTWVKDDVLLLSLVTQAGTLAKADTWLKNNLPCYPHNIGVADKHEARSYQWNIAERVPHAPYVRQANGLMAQTNHYFVVPEGWGIKEYDEGGSSSGIPGG